MRQIAKSALFWLFLVGVHFVVAVGAGMLIGWGPELLFDRYYLNTGVQAFSPAIAFTALVLAFVVGPKIKGGRGATFVWAVGLLWFAVGLKELATGWDPSWSLQKSRWAYAMANLFGPVPSCSSTECLYELLFTTPLVASIAYSFGALVRNLRHAREAAQTS